LEQLGLNWQGLLASLINFGLLMFVLWLVLYKPVVNMLDKRAAKIKEGLEKADEMKLAAERAKEEQAAAIELGRKEGQAIVARAEQIAARIREEAQEQAKGEAERFLAKARAEIEMDKQRAVAELRAQVADLAMLAAGRVVGQSLDNTAHYRLIEEVLDEARLKG
jgi:F-type H+-transporting ATPase subunit b